MRRPAVDDAERTTMEPTPGLVGSIVGGRAPTFAQAEYRGVALEELDVSISFGVIADLLHFC